MGIEVQGMYAALREFEVQCQRIAQAVEYNMRAIGTEAVKEARLSGNYTNRTGHLRNSISYALVVDGRVTGRGSIGSGEAQAEGVRYAVELAQGYGRGEIALIVVAGKDYASYVEDMGYDVLDSGEIVAQRMVSELMKDIKSWL